MEGMITLSIHIEDIETPPDVIAFTSSGREMVSWKMGGATVIVGAEKALPLLKSLIDGVKGVT